VTKTYDARLATRITSSVDSRLRQLALLDRRRISHLLDDVLDMALPSAEDLAGRFAHQIGTAPGLPRAHLHAGGPRHGGGGPGRRRTKAAPSRPARKESRQ
jgi:hypothetical protein